MGLEMMTNTTVWLCVRVLVRAKEKKKEKTTVGV